MADSIKIGADGQANHTLAHIRQRKKNGKLATDVKFLPGFGLHADPKMNLSGSWRSEKGRVLDLNATIPNHGKWLGLHLALPISTVRPHGVLGFAARIQAPEIFVARACLRSGHEDGFVDCFFDKHILFTPEESSHVDALQIKLRDLIPEEAPWRELILFLPTESFELSLIDWRVFVV